MSSIGNISSQLMNFCNVGVSAEQKQVHMRIANLEMAFNDSLPKSNSTDPLLTKFYKLNLIPKTFAFTQAQEMLTRSLFEKWHLDDQISLIDLLGLEIYEQFKKICGASESKTEILKQFGSTMMKANLLLYRKREPIKKENQKFLSHKDPSKTENNSGAICLKPGRTILDFSTKGLEWAKPGIALLENICMTLSSEREAMMARLALAVSPEGRPLEDLQKIAFEESVVICQIALILRDASALLGLDDLSEDIPPSLADFIELDGIESHLERIEPEVLSPIPQAPAPPPKVAIASVSSPVQAEELFTLESHNSRKVLKKLQQAGFQIYRTGRHHILKRMDGGASVVVPSHGAELKEGTLKSIQEQARKALGSLAI